ncbi:MAG: PD40 domain-containing protein, partial [Chloroflexi bacterium]|nr:PD40 domain-containing protein [Chloroflexota bacterium]
MNFDGSNQVNLSNTPCSNEEPGSWSPDGSKLAFSTFRGGNNE